MPIALTVSPTSIDKNIVVQHLRRPIWCSRRKDPCCVKKGILIRMGLIAMGVRIGIGSLINKNRFEGGAFLGVLFGRRTLNRIITVHQTKSHFCGRTEINSLQDNPDFSNLQGNRTLVQQIRDFGKSGAKMQCLINEGK